ncbi:MAG: DUF1738 domain-containing protein [Oscillospiraceae bacterium]|nr:DUF1738 domain-containing protein [Oscillospiraceae bacterium]
MAAQNKLREEMANRFLEALKQDKLPWQACWQQSRPQNAVTEKLYRGINSLYLSYVADELGYKDPRWCTYNQAQEKGWQVRKGAKAARVEYWAYYDTEQKKLLSWQEVRDRLAKDPEYIEKLQLRSRVYAVFNAEQIDGIPALAQSERHTDIGALRQQRDTLIFNMGVGYEEHGDRAFYSPGFDTVTLPPEESFDDTYSYMATFLHECGHATGHHTRLDRDLSGGFGSPDYAREELRAEIASAFTAQALGLQMTDEQLRHHMELHIAYVQNWIQVLQKSPEELFRAVKAAEEISDYLIEKGEFDRVAEQTVQAPRNAQSTQDTNVQAVTADGAYQRYLHEKEDRMRYPENSQEPTSLLTAPSVRLRIAPQYPWASRDQLDEIAAGFQEVLTPEQVNLYARPEFSAIQMNSIRYALQDGLSMAQLQLIADPAFTSVQMDVLRCCFQAGMTMDQMTDFARPEVPAQQMLERYWAVKQGQELAVEQAQAADSESATDVSCEPEFGQDL